MELEQILEALFKRMVEHPDELTVEKVGGNHTVIFDVVCHPRDIGILLGRQGVHAISVRKLLKACGGRDRKYYDVQFPEGQTSGGSRPGEGRSHRR